MTATSGRRAITAPFTLTLALATREARGIDPPDDRDKALPCRPTIACTADFVRPGTFELESGVIYRSLPGASRATRQWTFPFLAKLTMAEWVQLQVGSNGATFVDGDAPARYLDNVAVGAKLHLHDQTDFTPSLSLSAAASIPTWDDQEGYARAYDATFLGYVTKDFGPLHADFNTGVTVLDLDTSARPQPMAALALSASLPPPFGAMAEAYYFSDASAVAMRDGGLLFAVTHSPRPWLVFDAGGDVGWFSATRAYSVFIGMSIAPVVLWRPR
jgi:hypothetical protein